MTLDDFRARAKERLQKLSALPNDGLDTFQRDALAFFSRVPEPPLYRRRDDPTRALATTLLDEAETLVARAWRLGSVTTTFPDAIEAHVEALALIAEGKVEAAEPKWHQALVLERAATAPLRLWTRTDAQRPKVFDEQARASRFDPRPEPQLEARLVCPSCHKVSSFSVSSHVATHSLQCPKCAAFFTAYIGELRSLEARQHAKNRRRYRFHVEDLSSLQSWVEFDDTNPGELSASRRDLLAFLYEPATQLRGVLNLNTSRVLWVSSPSACFVATVAFGEGAPELDVLRGFRDEVLEHSVAGRAFIAGYYAVGPGLAGVVKASPELTSATRQVLGLIVKALMTGAARAK